MSTITNNYFAPGFTDVSLEGYQVGVFEYCEAHAGDKWLAAAYAFANGLNPRFRHVVLITTGNVCRKASSALRKDSWEVCTPDGERLLVVRLEPLVEMGSPLSVQEQT